jgi:hypothetical protein
VICDPTCWLLVSLGAFHFCQLSLDDVRTSRTTLCLSGIPLSVYTYLWLMQSTFWQIPHLTTPIFFILHRESTGEKFSRVEESP